MTCPGWGLLERDAMRKLRKPSRQAITHGRSASKPFVQATAAFEAGDYAQAASNASAVLALQPEHLGALEVLARSQWRRSRFDEALDALDTLVRVNPYEPGYFYMRGLVYQSLGRFVEAHVAFERCLASGDSPVFASATAAMTELEAWQRQLIQQLIQEDRAFRIAYQRDAIGALAERGFRLSEAPARGVAAEHIATRIARWDRPS